MMTESVEGLEAVYGQAQSQLESGNTSVSNAFLPFLFSLVPKDPHHLRLCVSDFHALTWRSDFSIQELQDLRDELGIGGSWKDFLGYMSTALSSNNVKLILGGPTNAAGGHGFTLARIVAQKARGTPRLSLPVTKLEGLDADDARGSIALGMFQAFREQSLAVASEKAQVAYLTAALASEKAKAEKLQDQLDASNMSFTSRRKLHKSRSSQLPFVESLSQPGLPLSQLEKQEAVPSLPAASAEDGKVAAKPSGTKSRVHVAPASRRAKRRGTAISGETDT